MATYDLNGYLIIIGYFGKYQILLLLLTTYAAMLVAQQIYLAVFTHDLPNFRCLPTDEDLGLYLNMSLAHSANVSLSEVMTMTPEQVLNISMVTPEYDNKCEYTILENEQDVNKKCAGYEFAKSIIFEETASTKYELVCEREAYGTITETAVMVCGMIGAILFAYITDRFGRKKTCWIMMTLMGVLGTVQAFSPVFALYAVCRVLIGSLMFGFFAAATLLLAEWTAPDRRSQAMNIIAMGWVVGSSSMSLLGYYLTKWWHMQLVCSIPAIVLGILMIWLVEETPHWLVVIGKRTEALKVMKKVARINGVGQELTFTHDEFQEASDKDEGLVEESWTKIFKLKRLLIYFLIISYGWFISSLGYFAFSFGVGNLAGDIFINNFIMCAVEGIAYGFCFLTAYLGRKWPVIGSFLLGGAALLVATVITKFAPEAAIAVTAMSVIGKFAVSATWQILFIWGSEAYPTTMRCTLVAINSAIARAGGVLAPFMVSVEKIANVKDANLIMPTLFTVLMLIGAFLSWFVPETNRCKLPETSAEANVRRFEPAFGSDDELSPDSDQKHELLEKSV